MLVEEQQWYYLTHSWEIKGVDTFPKSISLKVNVLVRPEFKLAYFETAVQHFSHYAFLSTKCKIFLVLYTEIILFKIFFNLSLKI